MARRSFGLRESIYFSEPTDITNSLEAIQTRFMSLEAANDIKTFNTIKNVFEQVCGHVKFDVALAKKVVDFQMNFVYRNDDHVAFFGGVLTGVQVVRFTSTDMARFFADVLQINELELEDELHQLRAIVADRKVSGDVFNHTCLWVVHKFLTCEMMQSNDQKVKDVATRAALAAALVLQYRFLTSLLSWYFKFPANPEDAQAAYSRLTKKSAIKQYGSWHKLLEARCRDFFPPDGLHSKTLMTYSDDYGIIYALNDSQGRIRSMMKHLMSELIAAKNSGARVRSTTSVVELDGESFLRDKASSLETYAQYLFNILSDEHTFVKQEIVDVLSEAMETAPPTQTLLALRWISKNFKTAAGKEIDAFIQETLIHSFGYLEDNRTVMRQTVGMVGLILRLKGVYMASRSTDPKLARVKTLADAIVKASITSKNAAVAAAVRTTIMLYVVVRALSMNHYSK